MHTWLLRPPPQDLDRIGQDVAASYSQVFRAGAIDGVLAGELKRWRAGK